jgi:Domain of unknown function DUF1828
MNCTNFSTLTGMRCEPVPMRDGSAAIAVITPFTFFDGDGVEVFASSVGTQVHLFDDGLTMHWLHSIGLRVGQDRRRWSALRAVAQTYGVHLGQDGCLQVLVAHDHASAGFARMVSAQLAIDAWAREHVGLPHAAQWLIEEASLYLRAWRPQVPLELDPLPVTGASGDHYRFHASKGVELIDAITPHRNTTSQELRKLVDVRRLASNAELQIRVILDDRRDAESAAKEAAILGSMATTWTMSKLIKAAGVAAAIQ